MNPEIRQAAEHLLRVKGVPPSNRNMNIAMQYLSNGDAAYLQDRQNEPVVLDEMQITPDNDTSAPVQPQPQQQGMQPIPDNVPAPAQAPASNGTQAPPSRAPSNAPVPPSRPAAGGSAAPNNPTPAFPSDRGAPGTTHPSAVPGAGGGDGGTGGMGGDDTVPPDQVPPNDEGSRLDDIGKLLFGIPGAVISDRAFNRLGNGNSGVARRPDVDFGGDPNFARTNITPRPDDINVSVNTGPTALPPPDSRAAIDNISPGDPSNGAGTNTPNRGGGGGGGTDVAISSRRPPEGTRTVAAGNPLPTVRPDEPGARGRGGAGRTTTDAPMPGNVSSVRPPEGTTRDAIAVPPQADPVDPTRTDVQTGQQIDSLTGEPTNDARLSGILQDMPEGTRFENVTFQQAAGDLVRGGAPGTWRNRTTGELWVQAPQSKGFFVIPPDKTLDGAITRQALNALRRAF